MKEKNSIIEIVIKNRNFPFVRLGRPPSREYKQSMAMQASPLPSPLKRKINAQVFMYLMGPF